MCLGCAEKTSTLTLVVRTMKPFWLKSSAPNALTCFMLGYEVGPGFAARPSLDDAKLGVAATDCALQKLTAAPLVCGAIATT